MLKVIWLQLGLIAGVALIATGLAGARGGCSALMGGMAYLLPNLLFVLRLQMTAKSGRTNVVTFFVGEFFKIVGTIGILFVAQHYYNVHWLYLFVGLIAALKANLFAFLLKT